MGYLLRIIIILLLGFLAFRLVHALRTPDKQQHKTVDDARDKEFIACERCGLHVPKDEAISQGGKYYCSVRHLENKEI